MKIVGICLTMIFFLMGCPFGIMAMAAEKGQAESGGRSPAYESDTVGCYRTPKYVVVEKPVKDGVGTDFLIKYRSKAEEKASCAYLFTDGDFEIKNEWAEYFAGLTGDLLLLDSTTGPGPSGLTIWDLGKRKKVFEGTWSDSIVGEDSILYWMETGEATEENCPELAEWEAMGLGGAVETRVVLRLSDFSLSDTAETRCSPRQ
jgi:hypothetical protein